MAKIKGLHCILLVDDDDPTNFIHRKVIKSCNIETHIESITGGEEALEYLTSTGHYSDNTEFPKPGIIFLDINMPGMDGWEFLEDYHGLGEDQKAKIVVVMLTSSINPADKHRASSNKDITMFLTKPLTKEAVSMVIENYFE